MRKLSDQHPPAAMTGTSPSITVYKLDHRGQEVWQYPARVLERGTGCIRLEAYFNREDMDLGYTIFKRGDRFIEMFYEDRWFNVFAIYDRDDGLLKGWYCNICRPAKISETTVRCDDLALDVWIPAHGEAIVLDEDEFEALSLPPEEFHRAQLGLAELLGFAKSGRLPR